jgi:HEPN domain-containing protein
VELQVILNAFASDVFRKQADCDYIAARSNYRMRLRQQFLWSAHQAVEKYLKATLLFNGRSARYIPSGGKKKREFGHDLDALLSEVRSISIFHFEIEPEDEKFLSYLSSQGGANRYLSTSVYNLPDAILRLDRLVWHVRRYCQYIPRGVGSKDVVPGLQEAVVRTITDPAKKKYPHSFAISGGELEAVIKRGPEDPARKALFWANLWYGKKRRLRVTYASFSSSEIPPNEREWKNVDWKLVEEHIKL